MMTLAPGSPIQEQQTTIYLLVSSKKLAQSQTQKEGIWTIVMRMSTHDAF